VDAPPSLMLSVSSAETTSFRYGLNAGYAQRMLAILENFSLKASVKGGIEQIFEVRMDSLNRSKNQESRIKMTFIQFFNELAIQQALSMRFQRGEGRTRRSDMAE
jgi:hypothetical protein